MDLVLCLLVYNLMYSVESESPQWIRSSELLLWKSTTSMQETVIAEVDIVSVEYLCVCMRRHINRPIYYKFPRIYI